MKIQIVVCGWWYDKFDNKESNIDFINSLLELEKTNTSIDVFWSCHKTPPSIITDNFKFKQYDNIGLEWGAYHKGFNDLNLDNDTLVYFIQDDIEILDWNFLEKCSLELLQGKTKFIGNGFNYPYFLNPIQEARLSYWLKTKDRWIDYVRDESKHLFTEPLNCLSIRGSFLATKARYVYEMQGFEYINRPLEKGVKENGEEFLLVDPYGNTALYLNAYKINKVFGVSSLKWLSNVYRKSKWMTECGRGQVDLPQDSQTAPFNIPSNFLLQ